MDPLSITTTVTALTATCVQTAKAIDRLRSRYARSQATLTAICSEITVIGASLSHLQMIMLESSDILSGSSNMMIDVRPAFETVLTGCMVVFSALDEEVRSLMMGTDVSTKMPFFARAKVIWKESEMQDMLSQIRNQQTAMNMLINLLQMKSASEIRRKIDINASMLADIARGTNRIRSARPSLRATGSIYEAEFETQQVLAFDSVSSIGTADFEFDDVLVNSAAYRRVLRAAQSAQQLDQGPNSSDHVGQEIIDDGGSEHSAQTARPGQAASVTESPEYVELLKKLSALETERQIERDTQKMTQESHETLKHKYSLVKKYYFDKADEVTKLQEAVKKLTDGRADDTQSETKVTTVETSLTAEPTKAAPPRRKNWPYTQMFQALNEE